jgi:hypothetical protein
MKKTYIIPQVLIVRVAQTLPLMGSNPLDTNGATFIDADATGAAMTKQNNYSVWGDDWSAE